jgi:anti-sigma B factor antagonist
MLEVPSPPFINLYMPSGSICENSQFNTLARRSLSFPGATQMPEESEKVLSFEIERDGDKAVVKCRGRLVAGTTEELYQQVKHLLPETKVVIIDLAELTYVDSSGLGALVRLHASARKLGCEFKLLHLGKQLRNILKLTNLLSVFGQVEDHGINIA